MLKQLTKVLAASLVLLLTARFASAVPPELGLPIQCQIGVNCSIQNFYDHDSSPGWRDYACGTLSYNGHTGTDFRVPDLVAMNAGVNVLAAAAGTVIAIREGEPDISVRQRGRSALRGKDAGNAVRISHTDGWETQYSHLKRGSITVRVGQSVEAGMVLGQVGLSGNTEFPHVDFTIRHLGRAVDPFAPEQQDCGISEKSLWKPDLAKVLSYRSTGLLVMGFAPEQPERERAEAGDYSTSVLASNSSAIVLWMSLFGLQKNDILEIRLINPNGQELAINHTTADSNKAVWFAFVGKRRTTEVWPTGTYIGHVVLHRGEHVVIDGTRVVTVH